MGGPEQCCRKVRNPAIYPGGRCETSVITSLGRRSKDSSVLHEESGYEDMWRYVATRSLLGTDGC